MIINRRIFLQQLGFGAAVVSSFSSTALAVPLRANGLPRSAPGLQGVSSKGILDFVNAVETAKLNLHSLMVLRHGKVVAEGWWAPYAPDLKHTLYSLSKSFTSSAIGLAVTEGLLKVDDKVMSFFPEYKPATVSENQAAMRVKDLLSMATGHDKDSTGSLRESPDQNWVKAFLALPVEHEPGTHFVYNSGATYMLSAIVQKLTGQTVLAYLKPRLFDPLGISGEDWEVDPKGINTGGWGLRVKTEDIAKFGQMYLQKGMFNGKQILPAAWVEEATKFHIQQPKSGTRKPEDNDWLQGYGYQFWRCRHDAYRGDGAFGQYCIVMPKEDMVIAITSESSDMPGILDQVWQHILPAAQQEPSGNKQEETQLKQKLTGLALPMTAGKSTSGVAGKMSGKQFGMDENTLKISQVSLDFKGDSCTFQMKDDKGEHRVVCGIGKWKDGYTDLSTIPLKLVLTPVPGEVKSKIAASGIWVNENTFEIVIRYIETAHYDTVHFDFEGDGLKVAFKRSLAIINNAKDSRPVLNGKLIA